VEIALGEHSPRIEIDGDLVDTCTRIAAAGGYVLTLTTVLPRRGVELHSTYTGHPLAEHTLVSELFLCKSRDPLLGIREADPRELPVLQRPPPLSLGPPAAPARAPFRAAARPRRDRRLGRSGRKTQPRVQVGGPGRASTSGVAPVAAAVKRCALKPAVTATPPDACVAINPGKPGRPFPPARQPLRRSRTYPAPSLRTGGAVTNGRPQGEPRAKQAG
jgi:hypothetical protein